MAEDAMMPDQAMDIDDNASSAPSIGSISAATSRNPLRARRDTTKPAKKRATITSRKIQKSSTHTKTKTSKPRVFPCPRLEVGSRAWRKTKIQRAIFEGTFEYRDRDLLGQEQEMHYIKRLDVALVTAALFEPVPGMTFDPAAPCVFTNQAHMMVDLVQALEAFQMHLARKGKVVLSDKAGPLLRGFARDILATVLHRPDGSGRATGVDGFWEGVAADYLWFKQIKWFARMLWFHPTTRDINLSERDYMDMVVESIKTPDQHPEILQVVSEMATRFPIVDIVVQPATLQALMSHFETARARYLSDLNTCHGPSTAANPAYDPKDPTKFGKLPRSYNGQDDSEDEGDGLRGGPFGDGPFDGGAEDDGGQIEEDIPSYLTQWFLNKLDKWTASKNVQQGLGYVDMFSALDLGEAK